MENKVTARNPITEGCIWKGMLLFALPIMLGSLLQQLYNTADAVIVGRALGKAALASVGGSSGRITNLLVNAFVALSSGASVIVAQHFGARDTQRVRRSICTAMLLSVVCGILLTVLGITSARQLLVWMQTTPETLDASASYLRIFFLGMVPTMLYNMGSGILRAMGDSKRPLYYLFVCVVANIALDLLFVIVFQWGIEGAAAATALSQVVCAALVVRALRRSQLPAVRAVWSFRAGVVAKAKIAPLGSEAQIAPLFQGKQRGCTLKLEEKRHGKQQDQVPALADAGVQAGRGR